MFTWWIHSQRHCWILQNIIETYVYICVCVFENKEQEIGREMEGPAIVGIKELVDGGLQDVPLIYVSAQLITIPFIISASPPNCKSRSSTLAHSSPKLMIPWLAP